MGRTSPQVLFVVVAAFALLVTGCASVANPEGWAPPSLEEGTLYASVDRGKMAALDPDDLSAKWVFPPDTEEGDKLDLEGIYGAPIVDGDAVYLAAYDGNVYALNADDGTLRWAFETDDPVIGSLTLKNETLYVGSTDGLLYAIDITECTNSCTLSAAQTFDTESSIWASPLVTDTAIYVATMSGRLRALNPDTLQEIEGFDFETNAGLLMDPTLASDEMLLVAGIDGKLYALDARTGAEIWTEPFEGGNWFWGRPLIDGGTVYIADLDGNVQALGLDDGRPLWPDAFTTDAAVRAAPLLAGETLVVVDRSGNAYGVDPETGTQQWGPSLLDKTVLSDPFLLDRAASPVGTDTSPSATPGEGSPAPTSEPSPTAAAGDERETVVLIVAQGGDLCTIDPSDGSPVGSLFCAAVPL